MKKLISVVGTTGIGKTKLAIALAKHFNTEIISCDSRQFFREMPVGTASPSAEELSEAPHHFIGHLSVKDYYSIGQFEIDALDVLERIFEQKNVVIMAGGSMMYENAVIEGLHQLPEADTENQKKLAEILKTEGIGKLQEMLKSMDEAYFNKVDLENSRRLLRAIDVMWQTGETYSGLISKPLPERNFETIRIGIEAPRETIYERINARVDLMLEQGLLDEVKSLVEFKDLQALKTVGYTELFKYLDGEWDFDFAVSEIKKNSRRFAKRQLTWYRGEENIHWVDFRKSYEDSLSLLKELEIF